MFFNLLSIVGELLETCETMLDARKIRVPIHYPIQKMSIILLYISGQKSLVYILVYDRWGCDQRQNMTDSTILKDVDEFINTKLVYN